jgi:hypothetical protein
MTFGPRDFKQESSPRLAVREILSRNRHVGLDMRLAYLFDIIRLKIRYATRGDSPRKQRGDPARFRYASRISIFTTFLTVLCAATPRINFFALRVA